MQAFRNKAAIITGASSGIGAATAVHFAKLGAWLTLTGRNKVNLEGVAKRCQEEAGLPKDKVLTVVGDIRDKAVHSRLVDETVEKFGRLDVLVNNAGVTCVTSLEDVQEENYDFVFDVNAKAPLFMSLKALPHLIQTKGNIVNVSSYVSTECVPPIGVYCATKAVVDVFTRVMATEFGPKGIRVNSVNPGFVETEIFQGIVEDPILRREYLDNQASHAPLGRNATGEEVAHAIAFLADEQRAAFITGHHLVITGGRHLAYPSPSP